MMGYGQRGSGRGRIVFFLLLVGIAVFFFYHNRGVRRSVAGIGDPIQTKTSKKLQFTLDDYQVKIDCLYSYDISALVVSTKDYGSLGGLGNKLAPKDVALAWGKVAEYNDEIDFHWKQYGRWYYWNLNSYDEMEMAGGEAGISNHSSNNHLIAADATVKSAVKKIKKGDYIRIKGYLVNVDAKKSDGTTFYWNSSTSREDSGDGACEVIYVTSVEWLD